MHGRRRQVVGRAAQVRGEHAEVLLSGSGYGSGSADGGSGGVGSGGGGSVTLAVVVDHFFLSLLV